MFKSFLSFLILILNISNVFSQNLLQDTLLYTVISQEATKDKWSLTNGWKNVSRTRYEYYSSGEIKNIFYSKWENNDWTQEKITSYGYQKSDSQVVKFEYSAESPDSMGDIIIYKYDSEHKLISRQLSVWPSGFDHRFIYINDLYNYNEDKLESIEKYNSNNIIIQKTSFIYNDRNLVSDMIETEYNNPKLEPGRAAKYLYDQDKNLVEVVISLYKDSAWVNSEKTTYYYDKPDTLVKKVHLLMGEWKESSTTETSLNDYGKYLDETEFALCYGMPFGYPDFKVHGMDVDPDGNLYTSATDYSLNGLGTLKIFPDGSKESYAPKGGESFFNDLRFGWGDTLFGVRNLKAVFSINKDVSPKAWYTHNVQYSFISLEVDSNYLWVGAKESKIFRISRDKSVKEFDCKGTIRCIRIFNNNLYVIAERDSLEKIVQFPILENGELGSENEFLNFLDTYPGHIINSMAFTPYGFILLGTDAAKLMKLDINTRQLSYYDNVEYGNYWVEDQNMGYINNILFDGSNYLYASTSDKNYRISIPESRHHEGKTRKIYQYYGTSNIREEAFHPYFTLEQNYPNPFNPSTSITFTIPKAELTTLTIYDMLGKEVTQLLNGILNEGNHSIDFNASGLPSGIYFYRLKSGSFILTKKMLVLK